MSMDRNQLELFQRVATLEAESETQAEAIEHLAEAVENLNNTLQNGKGAVRMFLWLVGFCSFGSLASFLTSIWHKS